MSTPASVPTARFYKYPDAALPHSLALGYAVLGWLTGFALIGADAYCLNVPGVLLLAHAMIIAAYLVHECAHNTVCSTNQNNARLGKVLLWVCGSSYATYEDIRHKHFRHHVDRGDVVAFDFRPWLAKHTKTVKVLEALEWAWIPAFDVAMHVAVIVLPFTYMHRRSRRLHVVTVLAARAAFFALLAAWSPRILLLYPLSYMLMLHVLRFMDAFQHTYDVDERLDQPRGPVEHDAAYEHRNTFTNLHSTRHPALNLFTLNFGYHNVHHDKPVQPWYRLPALQRELYGDGVDATGQGISFANQFAAYRRHRTHRLLNADPADTGLANEPYARRGRDFIGVDGVSFLTTH